MKKIRAGASFVRILLQRKKSVSRSPTRTVLCILSKLFFSKSVIFGQKIQYLGANLGGMSVRKSDT